MNSKSETNVKLCVLFGGASSEYEVSLVSAYGVLTNVDREKFQVTSIGITKDGKWYLYEGDTENIKNGTWCDGESALYPVLFDPTPDGNCFIALDKKGGVYRTMRFDAVFPVLHGAYGEDGTLQGMLSMAKLAFVGPDHTSSGVCMDKAFTKQIVNYTGIRQAKAVIALKGEFEKDPDAVAQQVDSLGYPVFVKPSRAGSSVGVSKAKNKDQLFDALRIAFCEDSKVLVEEFINGREVEVAVLEQNGVYTASVPGEIDPGCEFYDYETKYVSNTASYYIPARLDEAQTEYIKDAAVRIFKALDCRTLSRVDFFACENGEIVFNEINTIPGFTPISMYPKLLMHSGLSYSQVITALVESAINK